jgi:hypothetical protein
MKMALSNWDTVAIGPDGKPCRDGRLSVNGQFVELYKNWLYVGDYNLEKYKHFVPGKGGDEGLVPGFVNGVLAKIREGEIEMCRFTIKAIRGPQDSIMCFIVHRNYEEKKTVQKFFAGIAGYGYDEAVPKILKAAGKRCIPRGYKAWSVSYGHDPKKVDTIGIDLISTDKIDKDEKGRPVERVRMNWVSVPRSEEIDYQFVGILPATLLSFRKFLEATVEDFGASEWFRSIRWNDLTRVNQGDVFFANALGTKASQTKPGQAKRPVIEGIK